MSYILQEIAAECRIILQTWTQEHRRFAIAVGVMMTFFVAILCWQIFGFFGSLFWPQPIVLRTFSGTIKYRDNSVIPARSMSIELAPVNVSAEKIGHARPAYLLVDCSSGAFSGIIETLSQATPKLFRVVIRDAEGSPLPPNLVPEHLSHTHTSTLCVDISNKKVAIQVPKPIRQQIPEFAGAQKP